MTTEQIDNLVKYILACASFSDNFRSRNLKKIHIIKYIYLADLFYAERNGETYTHTNWKFYHYGPWEEDLSNDIVKSLIRIGAKEYSTKNDNYEFESYSRNVQDEEFEEIESKIPAPIHRLEREIKSLSNNTDEILHRVYQTEPMLNTKPNEIINFQKINQDGKNTNEEIKFNKTKKELASIKERAKEIMNKKMAQTKKASRGIYDQLYFDAMHAIDSSTGIDSDVKINLHIDDSIWKSEWRKSDLPE
jgi:hypothetical protein